MQILFINNDGGGFADQIEIAEDTTVDELFRQRLPYGIPDDYLIRVNRLPSSRQQRLQPGDRVSITPTKIEGAAGGRHHAVLSVIRRVFRSMQAACSHAVKGSHVSAITRKVSRLLPSKFHTRCTHPQDIPASATHPPSAVPTSNVLPASHANCVKGHALALVKKGNRDVRQTVPEEAHQSRDRHSRNAGQRPAANATHAPHLSVGRGSASAATASESQRL